MHMQFKNAREIPMTIFFFSLYRLKVSKSDSIEPIFPTILEIFQFHDVNEFDGSFTTGIYRNVSVSSLRPLHEIVQLHDDQKTTKTIRSIPSQRQDSKSICND